jgi:hypothetical protein
VLIFVAACSDDRGIMVEVNSTDASVAKIRLFVGAGEPTTTALTIAGPHRVDGAVYYTRDPNDANDVVVLTGGPRVAKFLYPNSGDIPIVIAVGYDANNQPVTAGVLNGLVAPNKSNQVNAYQIDLDTSAATSVFGTNGEVQLGLWSSVADAALDPYSAQCAGVQVGPGTPAYFIANPDDQDCDGYANGTALECTPNVYAGSTAADPSKPACLLDVVDPVQHTPYCYVGGKGCLDGVGVDPTSACAKTNICLPQRVCADCLGDFQCAADLDRAGHAATDGPHYECPIAAHNGQTCPTTLRLQRPPTGGYGCSNFQIGNDGFGTKLVAGAMELDALTGKDTSSSSCDATIDVVAGAATGGGDAFSGIANYSLVNNGGIAIPIEFVINNDNTAPCPSRAQACALFYGDVTIWSDQPRCASGWSAPAAVANIPMGVKGGVTLTADGLRMYFVLNGALLLATRSSVTQPWSFSTSMQLANARAPKLSADGQHLLYVATSGPGGNALTEASVSASGVVSMPTPFADNSAQQRTIESATYTPDPALLVVAATSGSGNPTHLFLVQVTGGGLSDGIELPLSLAAPNSDDRDPSMSRNGLHLYFVSNRGGESAIYVSSRATLADPFALPIRVQELGGVGTEGGFPFVTAQNDEVYYNGGLTFGSIGLLRATRGALP